MAFMAFMAFMDGPLPYYIGWKNDLDIGHPFESIRVGLGILNRSRDDSRLSDW